MQHKIDKNYLGEALKHFDIDGNQIIDLDEWYEYFEQDPDPKAIWTKAKTLIISILKDVFPNENPERLPMLADAILINHSEDKEDVKEVKLLDLYNYVIRFIAPQKYRIYQQQLDDKTQFFLYDGVIEREEFEIFTDDNNRLITADIYYFIISYHIDPSIAAQMIDNLITIPEVDYNPNDFSLDADSVFNLLAIDKYNYKVIDIDALFYFAEKFNINSEINHVFNLFGIHNDMAEHVLQTGEVDYQITYNFLNFHNKKYLEMGIQSLLHVLSIELEDTKKILHLIDFLGYRGKPHKIFKEIAGTSEIFTRKEVSEFLDDNLIPYTIPNEA